MRLKHRINNQWVTFIQFNRKYDYIIYPILIFLIYIALYKSGNVNITKELPANLINVSAVLIGFLFTAHSIILAMPSDKEFIVQLKFYGYLRKMFVEILMAEVLLGGCLINSLFGGNIIISTMLFAIGLTSAILLAKLLFTVSFYISR